MIKLTDTFMNRFNTALELRDMKPADIHRATGLSESLISQYRKGISEPKSDKIALLAGALRVNPAWLMGIDVPLEPHPIVTKLAADEEELIYVYRNADDNTRAMIKRLLAYAGGLGK